MWPERVLVVHNAYQLRGGEDGVVEAEVELLRARGHEVQTYLRSNDEIARVGYARAAVDTLWNSQTVDDINQIVDRLRPDVIHVHNTFPRISPSLAWAAARRRVPLVQTLHNFRMVCPQAMLLREGKVCEDCVGRVPWRSVVHRCYRGSRAQSAVLSSMLVVHRAMGTYRRKVGRYIALTDFARDLLVRGGLPAERIAVKPNFVGDPGASDAVREGFLFVGRLSHEKGVATLRDAARLAPEVMIDVVGDGPDASLLQGIPNVRLHGWCDAGEVKRRMHTSRALIMPSLWYEGFPRTLVEAFACGLPVIATDLGNLASLIRDGDTGRLVAPGEGHALADALLASTQDVAALGRMGRAARAEYERLYTPDRNHAMLLEIYRAAQAEAVH